MEHLEVLERLVYALSWHKQPGERPYHLLLTSSVSFSPEVRLEVCGSIDWATFQAYMQRLGPEERSALLAPVLQRHQPFSGYQALARLIRAGYFATIFLCSPDPYLEEQLVQVGCRPDVLIVGGYSDEHLITVLENPPLAPCLVKLHGGLKEKIWPSIFPHPSVLPQALWGTFQRYLNQNLLVVGSIDWDQDIARLLTSSRTSSLYYVVPNAPDAFDEIRKTLEARGHSLDTYLLSGELATVNTFFSILETRLLEKQALAIHPASTSQPGIGQATRADVLLVTVTQVETDAVLAQFPAANHFHDAYQTYYDLGYLEQARIFLVQQPTMGAGDGGGSILTIFKGIQRLAPRTVIMVGIAFGFDASKFMVGDILVSEQIQMYESQRVGSGNQKEPVFHLRGTRARVSPRLLSRFKSSLRGWQGARVDFGLILSGAKLIDNLDYRDQLLGFAPEALGGEMEGEGLHAATQDHAHKIDWILVKAISDWADGNKASDKSQQQQRAALNAAQFVVHVLSQGGFT